MKTKIEVGQKSLTCKELNTALDKILCGDSSGAVPKPPSPPPVPPLSNPLTVMGLHNTPVIIEDPVRFRKDIQTMVMAQMLKGLPSDEELKKINNTGSMIEIATVRQLVKAARDGDLDSFKYMMYRVLGKPVNQTNTVSVSVSYEKMLDQLDPEEVIEPKHVFCSEVE